MRGFGDAFQFDNITVAENLKLYLPRLWFSVARAVYTKAVLGFPHKAQFRGKSAVVFQTTLT